ncbi:MAG: Rieske 2Fe-2S domain-containing protein [Pigmentiphaga sp.]|uniref:aromatic ring-hydroxylating oxygenase subunit alpha n=1 Tax=Pigmentiphaga sp. TaxID=1977564 RepID=UPI0029B38CEE|nr:Rieske 2Fe-2S domain-containing protein [Pigmentiphaga sp.]MDX3906933.1 Rieske 2Fe-2S domain-containing protein [Pigmentiphaga sp.]
MSDLSTRGDERLVWPQEGVSRVPFRIFNDESIYAEEQDKVFKGPIWNFVGLDIDVPKPGDYKTTWIGETPVVLVRSGDDTFTVFVNRCAHRGATLCINDRGNARRFTCVYHNWSYDLEGKLRTVAFQRGVRDQGGMPADFDKSQHNLRTLRVEAFCGLVFATFSDEAPSVEEFLGPTMAAHMRRVFNRKIRVLGTYSQVMHNNWKLYMENVKDSYHASLLHLFFTTFGLNRLSMRGGLVLEANGGHHISFSQMASDQVAGTDYESGGIRAQDKDFSLHDPSLLKSWPEFEDGITHAIQGIFPNLIVQQIQNSLAIRLLVPQGPERCELFWILFGYEDDTPEQVEMRINQSNLVGPAGLVSLEDGVVGSFVQRTLHGERQARAVLEMGGRTVENQESRVSEASVRGFWQCYRRYMDL